MPSIDYDYFLRGNPSDVLYQCITIQIKRAADGFEDYHTFSAVANNANGITANYEGSPIHFEYVPLNIERFKSSNGLEQTFNVTVGDLGVEFGELIRKQSAYDENLDSSEILRFSDFEAPRVVYLEYLSSNLNEPFLVIENLELTEYKFVEQGGIFKVSNMSTNRTTTGATYNLTEFACLRGFY